MTEVIFNYEGSNTTIQCNINDKMKDIIDAFLIKMQNKENNLYYLYNGTKINYELTFNEQANDIDKNRMKMNIIVNQNEDDTSEDKHMPVPNTGSYTIVSGGATATVGLLAVIIIMGIAIRKIRR